MLPSDAQATIPLPVRRSSNGVDEAVSYISAGQLVLDRREPTWVVPDLIQAGALTVVAGDPKHAKKTLLMEWLAVCAATGLPFLGRSVEHAWPVVYTAHEESTISTAARLRRFGVPDGAQIPLILTFDEEGFRRAIRHVEEVQRPCLWIVDTLAVTAVLHGLGDEGKPEQMTRLLHPYRRLAHATGSAIVFVHHLDKARGVVRGTTALPASTSGWWEIRHRRGSSVLQIDSTQRDAPSESYGFEFVVRPDGRWAFEARDPPGIRTRPQEEAVELAAAVAEASGRKGKCSDDDLDARIVAKFVELQRDDTKPFSKKDICNAIRGGRVSRIRERFDALCKGGQISGSSGAFRLNLSSGASA